MADSAKKKPTSATKKVVSLSVRFEPDLWDEFDSYLKAIPWEHRPTKVATVQAAVRSFIRSGNRPEKANEKDGSIDYNLRVVRHKSQKVVEIMGEIISDLDLATGETIDIAPAAADSVEQAIHNLKEQSDAATRDSLEIEKQRKDDATKPGTGECDSDQRVSGRQA